MRFIGEDWRDAPGHGMRGLVSDLDFHLSNYSLTGNTNLFRLCANGPDGV